MYTKTFLPCLRKTIKERRHGETGKQKLNEMETLNMKKKRVNSPSTLENHKIIV